MYNTNYYFFDLFFKGETSITSTLKLAGVPKFKYKITIPFSYTCKMLPSPDNLQVNFPIYSIKGISVF